MIFGVGTDIVEVARVQKALADHGDRFAQRILAESEFVEFKGHKNPANYLAKRYAAKEAAAKAFGTGFSNGLSLRHIIVSNDVNGKPQLEFVAEAQDWVEQMGIGNSFVSLSDEKEYAVAFVVLELV